MDKLHGFKPNCLLKRFFLPRIEERSLSPLPTVTYVLFNFSNSFCDFNLQCLEAFLESSLTLAMTILKSNPNAAFKTCLFNVWDSNRRRQYISPFFYAVILWSFFSLNNHEHTIPLTPKEHTFWNNSFDFLGLTHGISQKPSYISILLFITAWLV